jgi:hypothetical protein
MPVLVIFNRSHFSQPSTGPEDPRTQAACAPVTKSYSRLTANVPCTTQRESTGSISRSTTSPLDEKNFPATLRTSGKTGGDGSSSHPEAMETSCSVQSLARSSSSHLPRGAPSASSLPQSPPPAVKRAPSSMRQTKDTPPGEPERRLGLGSSATYGRSHVDLPTSTRDSVTERIAVTAVPAPHQQSSAPPRIDRSTSRFQQPNQLHTVCSESFASGTASPIASSLPGGGIRRTGSSHPQRGSDNDASRADGASVPDTARSLGGLPPPPTKALSSPRGQSSNKNLVDPSASAEQAFLLTPHDTLARKRGEATDSPSDRKEGVCPYKSVIARAVADFLVSFTQ